MKTIQFLMANLLIVSGAYADSKAPTTTAPQAKTISTTRPGQTYAVYNHTKTTAKGEKSVKDLRMEIVKIEGKNITVKASENGKERTNTSTIGLGDRDIMTEDLGKQFVVDCEMNKGTREKITVAAGTFDTCKSVTTRPDGSKSTSWFAAVPFGWVKSEVDWKPTGNFNVFELKEFKR